MSRRIKVTGYLNPDDMDPTEVDLVHPTGLTEKGTDNVTSCFSDTPYKVADLEDIEVELVDE